MSFFFYEYKLSVQQVKARALELAECLVKVRRSAMAASSLASAALAIKNARPNKTQTPLIFNLITTLTYNWCITL